MGMKLQNTPNLLNSERIVVDRKEGESANTINFSVNKKDTFKNNYMLLSVYLLFNDCT